MSQTKDLNKSFSFGKKPKREVSLISHKIDNVSSDHRNSQFYSLTKNLIKN